MKTPKKSKEVIPSVGLGSVLTAASNSVVETPELTPTLTAPPTVKVEGNIPIQRPVSVAETATKPSVVKYQAKTDVYNDESRSTLQNRIKEAEFLDVFIDLDKYWVKLLENSDKLQTHMVLKKMICPKTGIINHRFAQAFAFTGLKHLGEEVPQFVKKSYPNKTK